MWESKTKRVMRETVIGYHCAVNSQTEVKRHAKTLLSCKSIVMIYFKDRNEIQDFIVVVADASNNILFNPQVC